MSLQIEVAALKAELATLRAEQEWQRSILEAHGIKGPWLTPAEAAPLIGLSKERIIAEINAAEKARVNKRRSDLKYGQHYINAQNPHDSSISVPRYKIHYREFAQVVHRPPDQRVA